MAAKIITNRLILRSPQYSDLNSIVEMDLDPEVQKYLFLDVEHLTSGASTRSSLRKKIKNEIKSGPLLGGSIWAIEEKSKGDFIGMISLEIAPSINKIAVSFRLHQQQWGFGYATEALITIIEHAFQTLKMLEIYALIHPENIGSQRAVEKAGFRRDGLLLGGSATNLGASHSLNLSRPSPRIAKASYFIYRLNKN